MESVKCAVCNVSNEKFMYRVEDSYLGNIWNMVKCRECSLVYLNPQPDMPTLKKTYRKIYQKNNKKRLKGPLELIEHLFRRMRAYEIMEYRKTGEILDIGCGRGMMLKYLKVRGWKTKGIEFSEDTGAIARRTLKHDLYIGTDTLKEFTDEQFDIIVIDYVLEHVNRPYEILKEVHRVLKKRGLLIVSVPDIESLQAVWTGRYWFHLDVPKHLYHYSTRTLTRLLEKSRFRLTKRKGLFLEHGLFGLWQSILNMGAHDNNRFFYSIVESEGDRNALFNVRNIGIGLLFAAMMPVLVLFSLIEKSLKRDGLIRCYAIKK